MVRYAMVIDLNRCIGCGACVMACITENRREQAMKAMERGLEEVERMKLRTYITRITTGRYPRAGVLYMHMICQHCSNPPCVSVCPTGASYIGEGGVVLVKDEKCIGCEYCVQACPYGARFWDYYIRSIDKCTFCIHRVKEGRQPACVTTCPSGARVFGDLDDPESEVSKIIAAGSAVQMKREEGTSPNVFYILPSRR
ncbi:MAG: 4Fe-4S dicluster domain-containing protein [Thermofilum sp.]